MKSVGLKGPGATVVLTVAASVVTGTTQTAVAGLSIPVPAVGQFHFEAILVVNVSLATVGIRPGVTGPTGTLSYRTEVPNAAAASTLSYNAAGAATASAATTNNYCKIEGVLTATAAGTLQVTIASSSTTGTVTPQAGSSLQLVRMA